MSTTTESETGWSWNMDLIEKFAALAHEQWSGWMNYLFEKCQYKGHQANGYTLILPTEYADRWLRQISTNYTDLPESEKDSDRNEAQKILSLFARQVTIADEKVTQLQERNKKAKDAKARFRFYEAPTWEDVDLLLSLVGITTPSDFEQLVRLREESLKGICVYCGEIQQYESLEQKASAEGNALRVEHIKQCAKRPELKLIDAMVQLHEAATNALTYLEETGESCRTSDLITALRNALGRKEKITMCLSFRSITDKEITVRKSHMCEWCADKIAKGEAAHYRAYVFDGEFTTGRMHLDCYEAFANSAHDVICEGWMPGDFERGQIAA